MATNHKEPLNAGVFLALVALLPFTIPAFIPKPVQVIAFVVVGCYACRIILTQTTGDLNYDLGVGSLVPFQYLTFLDFALLTPPQNLKNFDDKDPTSVTKRPFKQRLLWTLKLLSNPRGIGWAHEPSHLPPRPSPATSRSAFVIYRILFAAFCFSLMSGATYLFDATGAGIFTADKLLTGAPLHRRVQMVLCFAVGSITAMSGANAMLAACMVWSLRRFWRRFWHQTFRRCMLTCTSSLLRCVFPEKYLWTSGYKLARLYVVFFISGLVHAGGDVMASGKLSFKSFTFFVLQPFGIIIEIVVSYLWDRLHSDAPNMKKPIADEITQNLEPENRLLAEDYTTALDSLCWVYLGGSLDGVDLELWRIALF